MVIWSDLQKNDCTRELEKNVLNNKVLMEWDEKHQEDPHVYELQYALDSDGRANCLDVSSINRDIEKKSVPKEAAPESSDAPETSTAAPVDPTLSMVDTSSALFQLPADPPCDQVRNLDCDSDELCGGAATKCEIWTAIRMNCAVASAKQKTFR